MPCGALFKDEADEAMAVFSALRLVDVANKPTIGEISRPWFMDFPRAIFGSYDADNGRRLINEGFLCIPKKNAKSTLAAGVMATALIRNWRESAEAGILAPTKEVADNAYKPIRDMILADEELSTLLKVQDHIRTITHRVNGSTLKVVAADSDTVSGKKWSYVFVDELWLFGKRAKAADMLIEATGGLASRPEGFVIYATTQSDEPPSGVFREKLEYARRVRDGEVANKKFLPLIYEFPKAMIDAEEHLDQRFWHIPNPNWGASVDAEYISDQITKAKEGSGESLQLTLAKHLNIEVGNNLRSDRWAGVDFWLPCGDTTMTLESLIARSEVIVCGIDGGGLDDLLGFCALGRERGTGQWLHWGHAWAHTSVLERRKKEEARFKDFERQGDLTIIKDIGQDVEGLVEYVKLIRQSKKLHQIACDQNGIGAILEALEAEGFEANKDVIGVSQGWKLVGAIKTLERQLAGKSLTHCGQPLMAWSVSNARTVPRGNAVSIEKSVSGSAKIDPLVAMLIAAQILQTNPAPPGPKHQFFTL